MHRENSISNSCYWSPPLLLPLTPKAKQHTVVQATLHKQRRAPSRAWRSV